MLDEEGGFGMCHSVRRKTGFVSLVLLSLGVLAACGDDDGDDNEDAASTVSAVSYDDIKEFVETDCGSSNCHASNGPAKDLSTQANLDANKSAVLTRIAIKGGEALAMPPAQGDAYPGVGIAYETTTNGALLKQYLEGL